MTSLISIGVSDYDQAARFDPTFGSLDYAVSDAVRFAQVATSRLKIRRHWVLSSDDALDKQATRINIIRTISELAHHAPKTSIIYFSGHGVDVDGALHLCPQDFDPRVAAHSSIRVSFLVELLANQPGWCLLIIDACRNIPPSLGRLHQRRRTKRGGVVFVADNVCILLACSNGQQSLETPSIYGQPAGGVFTHFLCESLRETPISKRRVSVGALFDNAQQQTSVFSSTYLERQQTPRAVGMNPHDVYLACLHASRQRDETMPHPLA